VKIKSQRDFFSGLMFVVLGVVFAVRATHYAMGSSARPGLGYFPLILGVLLAVLGALLLLKALAIETEGGNPLGHVSWRPVLAVSVAVAFFAFAVNTLGWVLTAPSVVLMASWARPGARWAQVAGCAVACTVLLGVVAQRLGWAAWPLWPHF
jgi:hypothetical protein